MSTSPLQSTSCRSNGASGSAHGPSASDQKCPQANTPKSILKKDEPTFFETKMARIRTAQDPDEVYFIPYNQIPRHDFATASGWVSLSPTLCPFSGATAAKLRSRRRRIQKKRAHGYGETRRALAARANEIHRAQIIGDFVNATRTPGVTVKSGPKRKGAKAIKKLERLPEGTTILDPQQATNFRALSARANYMAQDRPDVGFQGTLPPHVQPIGG